MKIVHLPTHHTATKAYQEAAMLRRLEGAGVRVPCLRQLIWTREWAYLAMTCARPPSPRRPRHARKAPQERRAAAKRRPCPTSAAVY